MIQLLNKAFHKTLMAVCINKTIKALDPVAGFCYYTVISVNRNIFISLGKLSIIFSAGK